LITDPLFYAIAVPAVLITGISKGGVGGGLGMLGVLLMILVVPPPQAAAIMLPILCLMDPMSAWAYRRTWHRGNVAVLVSGAGIGVIAGILVFGLLDGAIIRLIIGALVMLFVANSLLALWRKIEVHRPSRAVGVVCGAVSGLTSFLVHAGMPTVAIYLLPQRMEKAVFVGTTVIYFFAVNYAKLVPYYFLGLFDTTNLATSLVLVPLAPIGIWLGVRINRWLSQEWFYRICYAFLFASGVKLLYDGATELLG
jgi:uncharacterized membrane protein YfcA